MQSEKIFESHREKRQKDANTFYILIRRIVGNSGWCQQLTQADQNSTSFSALQRGTIDKRRIFFSLDHETGCISITFILPVNNQHALECVKAGAHVAKLEMVFRNFTKTTVDELQELVRTYFIEGTEHLLNIFTSQKEKIPA